LKRSSGERTQITTRAQGCSTRSSTSARALAEADSRLLRAKDTAMDVWAAPPKILRT
jgi:hypothetical protein